MRRSSFHPGILTDPETHIGGDISMQWLTDHPGGLDAFFDHLRKATTRVLVTDYDGTLSPFVFERNRAVPYEGIPEMLDRINTQKDSRVVLLTGRTVEDQRRRMDLRSPVEIWGTHGWEHATTDGSHRVWPIGEKHSEGLSQAISWATREDLLARIETKPATVALHWRSAAGAERERIVSAAEKAFAAIAEETGLLLQRFDGGLELRTPGRDKGDAIREILAGLGEGEHAIACLGDDTADEDAFLALEGKGLRVLVGLEIRETAADLHLRPPREVLRFLSRWLDAVAERG